jgi:predicted dehydrogenase
MDIAVHMADLLQWILGEITDVAAVLNTRTPGIDVPDNACALFRAASGATGVLELSWTAPVGAGLLEVYGTRGRIRMGFTPQPIELTTMRNGKAETVFPEPKKRVKNSFQCFVEAVNGKADSLTPGTLGRDALALCEAIAKSGEAGRFVKVSRRT